MKRFSDRFWLIVWPIVAAAIHGGLLCGLVWLFPSKGEPGISLAFPALAILLWPWLLCGWLLGAIGAFIGIVLAFLWFPAVAFWITWWRLKKKDKRTPNTTPDGICQPADGLPKPSV